MTKRKLKNYKYWIIYTLLCSMIIAVEAFSASYYVAQDGSGDFTSIKQAIDAAQTGDQIYVKAGNYQERVRIATSNVDIIGEKVGDEWKTILDPSVEVSDWRSIGNGVWTTNSIPFNPALLSVDDKMLVRIRDDYMSNSSTRSEYFNRPASNSYTPRYIEIPINWWDGVEAIYGYYNGTTYIRFRNGDDPNNKNIKASSGGAGFMINDASNVTIKNIKIQGTQSGIIIDGNNARNNIIEDNFVIHGPNRIEIVNGASFNQIRNNTLKMNYYGYENPGAWEDGKTREYAIRTHIYQVYKYVVSDYGGSDDHGIRVAYAGSDNEIYGNHIFQGLIGIIASGSTSNPVRNLKVYNNVVHNFSSIGILPMEGLRDAEFYDNLVYDCSINLRLHHLKAAGDYRTLYIYRNRFYNPPDVGDAFFTQFHSGGLDPEIYIYHNSIAGGAHAFYPGGAIDNGGLPGIVFLNNIFSSPRMFYAAADFFTNENMVGVFDYNWAGGEHPRGHGVWYGDHNIDAEGQYMWDNSQIPDFQLPEGSPAMNAGIDLSSPFTIDGVTYDPLPGMDPGYYSGSKPDLGALYQPAGYNDPDIQAPTIPTNFTATPISGNQVNLSWSASLDNIGVVGYKIFRDANQTASTENTSYSDTGLQPATTYTYTILAYDAAGNESAQSSPVIVTTTSSDTTGVDLTILTVSTIINLDGDLSEFANADSAVFSPSSGGNLAIVKSIWDSEYLYIGYEVFDTQLNAVESTRDGNVWNDDAVEWFIDVNNDGGGETDPNLKYMNSNDFHGMINILNTQFDCCGSPDGTPTETWNGSWESAVRVIGTLNDNIDSDIGYNIEVRIPWNTLGLEQAPAVNSVLTMSFSNEDRDAGDFSYVMWPNITTSFQNASNWQPVLLTGDSEAPTAPTGLTARLID